MPATLCCIRLQAFFLYTTGVRRNDHGIFPLLRRSIVFIENDLSIGNWAS